MSMYGYGIDPSYCGYGAYGNYGAYGCPYGAGNYGTYGCPRRSIFDSTLLNAGGVAIGGAIVNSATSVDGVGGISRCTNAITRNGVGKACIYTTAALAGGWLIKQFFGSGN